jgi:hypothetical protein
MDNNEPVNPIQVGDILTNERNRARAEFGQLEFVTDTSLAILSRDALKNAVQAANGSVVFTRKDETEDDNSFYTIYLNNVESYGKYTPFTKDDILMTSESDVKVAVVERIRGPEANTFSGEVLYTENFEPVERKIDQTEDFKIILDF